MPAEGTGARFKVKVSENTNTNCKDAILSPAYSDVYDGQGNVFNNVAGQDTSVPGAVVFGNGIFPVEYIAEFPMPDPPKFGEAELDGMELNLYFSDINQTNDYTPLNLNIYKLKEVLKTEGNFLPLKTGNGGADGSDIYFASSVMDGNQRISEKWAGDGIDIDVGAFSSARGWAYLEVSDAMENVQRAFRVLRPTWTEEEFKDAFGTLYHGNTVIRIKPDGDNWKSYIKREGYVKYRPKWRDDDIKDMILYSGATVDMSHLDNTHIDITDTILEHIDSTEDYFTGDKDDDRNYTAFSRPYLKATSSPSNDVVFSMLHFTLANEHNVDPERSYSLKAGGDIASNKQGGTYQEIRTWFRIPSPQSLETSWDTALNTRQTLRERTGPQVEFVIKIDAMMPRSKKKRGGGEEDLIFPRSTKEPKTLETKQKLASMARSFIITLSDRPPFGSEKFHHFVHHIKEDFDLEPATRNRKILERDGGNANRDTAKFCGIAFWNDGTANSPKLRCVISSWGTDTYGKDNKQFFEAVDSFSSQEGVGYPHYGNTNDESFDGLPVWSYEPREQFDLSGNAQTSGIGLGDWFKVQLSYNATSEDHNGMNDWNLIVSILDMNDNLVNTMKFRGFDKYFEKGDGRDFIGDSMPCYCTLWCLSEGIEAAEEADYSTNEDTYCEVMIDSIDIRGFETTVDNATMGIHNLHPSPATLQAQPTPQKLINQRQLIPMAVIDGDSYVNGKWQPTVDNLGKALKMGSEWTNNTEDVTGCVPNYLSFGFKNSSALEAGYDTHLFLGGFLCDNLANNDGTNAAKYPNTINAWLGNDAHIGRILTNKGAVDLPTVSTNGTRLVDYFTRKGFVTIDNGTPDWERRENSLVATKITDISKADEGIIGVVDLSKLYASEEEEYVIFRTTDVRSSWANRDKVWKTGLKIHSLDKKNQIIHFSNDYGKLHKTNDGTNPLCVEAFKDELYISPWRYWLIFEIWNLGSAGEILGNKAYSHTLSQSSEFATPSTVSRVHGMTYNEFLYSDSPKHSNAWKFTGDSKFLNYEREVDYGYGTYEEKETGYLNTPTPIVVPDTHTKVNLGGFVDVEAPQLSEPNALVSLYIKSDAAGRAKLHTNKVSTTANRPFLTVIYKDLLPELTDFKVQPNEEDPFYPTYTWSTASDDLWYGFLIQDDKAIEHQYHSAVAHIPLNEAGTATYLHRYTNETAFGGSRVTATDVDKTTSIEGLAGNCLVFDGTTTRHTRFADNTYDQPTGEMSVVAHFVASAVDDTHYIVSKYTQFALYVDSSGYIHAKVHYDTSNSVNLKSISLVPTDGATPVNAIVTLDVGIPTGNVKLFINGKLEDQSGVKTTDGSVSNWKIDSRLPDPAKSLDIGMADTDGSSTMDHPFEGKIEEIVIYNKAIYPVVPQTGELSLFKPLTELTIAPIASGKSIVSKLFVKDYHNIRGTTTNQVTSSSMIAYRKAGVGLKTN